MKISIFGLGKLGLPMAAVMAHKGHTVIGVDLNHSTVTAVQEGRCPINEPGLADMLAQNPITATHNGIQAVLQTDVTFIMVPTPSQEDGTFSLQYVMEAAKTIGTALSHKRTWHLVVLSSTVMPQSTTQVQRVVETHSKKRCGAAFGLCYNPEFIALGNVIHDMLNPDMILIGESDQQSGDVLAALYQTVCAISPAIQRMNFVNAELTKLSVNTFVTTKISYANMLSEVCEKIPGADVAVVTTALGKDSRIGPKYLNAGLGYGGPCFPRDNVAFSAMARNKGVTPCLPDATNHVNQQQSYRLLELVLDHLPTKGTVGVLGLSYKPDTPVTENSQGLELCLRLSAFTVLAYDPSHTEPEFIDGVIHGLRPAREVTLRSDVVVITTAWDEFRTLRKSDLKDGAVVIDCWRILDEEEFGDRRIVMGRGPC